MTRIFILCALVGALVLSACSGPRRYEGVKFKVNLDSSPTGATLFVVPRSNWLQLAQPASEQDLERFRVKENGGVAPITDKLLVNYQHVLVGRLGDSSGQLEFIPTEHGQTVVVPLDQP